VQYDCIHHPKKKDPAFLLQGHAAKSEEDADIRRQIVTDPSAKTRHLAQRHRKALSTQRRAAGLLQRSSNGCT
jgi:hypothetical protein